MINFRRFASQGSTTVQSRNISSGLKSRPKTTMDIFNDIDEQFEGTMVNHRCRFVGTIPIDISAGFEGVTEEIGTRSTVVGKA